MTWLRLVPLLLAAMTLGAYFALLAVDVEKARSAGIGLIVAMGVGIFAQMVINGRGR